MKWNLPTCQTHMCADVLRVVIADPPCLRLYEDDRPRDKNSPTTSLVSTAHLDPTMQASASLGALSAHPVGLFKVNVTECR